MILTQIIRNILLYKHIQPAKQPEPLKDAYALDVSSYKRRQWNNSAPGDRLMKRSAKFFCLVVFILLIHLTFDYHRKCCALKGCPLTIAFAWRQQQSLQELPLGKQSSCSLEGCLRFVSKTPCGACCAALARPEESGGFAPQAAAVPDEQGPWEGAGAEMPLPK